MNSSRYKLIAVATASLAWMAVEPALGSEGAAHESSLFTGDLGNIIWSLLTFGVVLFVLGKFAWGPILAALQKREDFIRESLEKAKQDREEAEARLKEYAEKIAESKAEASAIVEEGRRDAEALQRKIEAEAREEADRMIERAKRDISVATDTAIKELYSVGGKLAVEVASRVIGKDINAADHERLISESIDELMAAERN